MTSCKNCKSKALTTDDHTGNLECTSCGVVQHFTTYDQQTYNRDGPTGHNIRLGTSGSSVETRFADELYPRKQDLSQPSIAHIDQSLSAGPDGKDEEWCEDESSWNDSDTKLDPSSDLDREWQRRKNQFHAIGYRDGVIAGTEASAQEGFNAGFKESVIVGFNLGFVRGITGALDCLSDELRGKIIESQEKRNKFHDLYKSVDKLSTADALTVFGGDLAKRRIKHGDKEGCIPPLEEQNDSDCSVLNSYYTQLQFLIMESPHLMDQAIDVSSTSQDPSLQRG